MVIELNDLSDKQAGSLQAVAYTAFSMVSADVVDNVTRIISGDFTVAAKAGTVVGGLVAGGLLYHTVFIESQGNVAREALVGGIAGSLAGGCWTVVPTVIATLR